MDTNGREFEEDHSCQLAFIRGSDPVWAGWNNREWTLMDANLRETLFVSIGVYSRFRPGLGRLE